MPPLQPDELYRAMSLKKFLAWSAIILGGAWTVFSFTASNSPEEVREKTAGWLSLPIVRDIPAIVIHVAAHPVTLAISSLLLGIFIGWRFARRSPADKGDPCYDLGISMSLLAHELRGATFGTDMDRLNAKVSVMRIKAMRAGIRFPTPARDYNTADLLPYLSHVSTLLREGEIEHARSAAEHFTQEMEAKYEKWDPA